jgi:hypothetical protein
MGDMRTNWIKWTGAAFCGVTLLTLGAARGFGETPQGQTLAALASIEGGEWQLKSKETGETKSMCLGDVKALLQVRHGRANCSRFVIANGPKASTVHYTCPGAGHGRTTIRVETPRLIQIESQGIANNAPFDLLYEGRRTGTCAAATPLSFRR